MTIKERADELLKAGAGLQVYAPGIEPQTVLLAALRWDDGPALRWCAVYPNDQHHVHTMPYTGCAFAAGGRDIAFYDRAKKLIAYISPYQECGLDEGHSRDILTRWRADLAEGKNQVMFDKFFAQN